MSMQRFPPFRKWLLETRPLRRRRGKDAKPRLIRGIPCRPRFFFVGGSGLASVINVQVWRFGVVALLFEGGRKASAPAPYLVHSLSSMRAHEPELILSRTL